MILKTGSFIKMFKPFVLFSSKKVSYCMAILLLVGIIISFSPLSYAVNPSEGFDIDILDIQIIQDPAEMTIEGFPVIITMKNTGLNDIGVFRIVSIQSIDDETEITRTTTVQKFQKNEIITVRMYLPLHENFKLNLIAQPPATSLGHLHKFDEKTITMTHKEFTKKLTNIVEDNESGIIVYPNYDRLLPNHVALRISYVMDNMTCSDITVKFNGQETQLDLKSNEMIILMDADSERTWRAQDVKVTCEEFKLFPNILIGTAFADTLTKLEKIDNNLQFELVPKEFYCINENDQCHTFFNNELSDNEWQNYFWNVIASSIGIAGIISTIVTYMLQRRKVEGIEQI